MATITGTSRDNRLRGTNGNDIIKGLAGNDTLLGLGGIDVLDGSTGNDFLDGGVGIDAMAGGAGNDTYVVDNARDRISESAGAGVDLVRASASYTLGSNLENLTLIGTGAVNGTGNSLANVIAGNNAANILNGLSGNDRLGGGGGNDRLEGSTGNDVLDGGIGTDRMAAGIGDDSYVVNTPRDQVLEVAHAGIDLVLASVNHKLANNVENLTLTATAITGTGNGLNNRLTGNAQANVLIGGLGDDFMDGGAGADFIAGGTGNDTYVVDVPGDVVSEDADAGIDEVRSARSWSLQSMPGVENLTLTGILDLNGTGNSQNNRLAGNAGRNVLDGGAGADVMAGGLRDDTYVVDDADDVVDEAAGAGVDEVRSSINWMLHDNVENLTLTGTAVRGTGNDLANGLVGNDADNHLLGRLGNDVMDGGAGDDLLDGEGGDDRLAGGSGNDDLSGGTGNDFLDGGADDDAMDGGVGDDTYVIDSAGDSIFEGINDGVDVILSSLQHSNAAPGVRFFDLRLYATVENLMLTGSANQALGNDLNNIITGNNNQFNHLEGIGGDDTLVGRDGNDFLLGGEGNDILKGGNGNDALNGDAGDDIMLGGHGDDQYTIDGSSGDMITELVGEGFDTVTASITTTLPSNIERLILGSALPINGTGNELNNVLLGNGAANTLNGGDGDDFINGFLGDDILDGGNHNDSLWGAQGYDRATGGAGADHFQYSGEFQAPLVTSNSQGEFSADVIADFRSADGDKVDISVMDANTLLGGNQEFTFIGAGGFSGAAGELRTSIKTIFASFLGVSIPVAEFTILQGDVNGDRAPDFEIAKSVGDVTPFVRGDLIL
jgi:Ca2+-binding RTX toxin-like protein